MQETLKTRALWLAVAFMLPACASVTVPMSAAVSETAETAPLQEHTALKAATIDLTDATPEAAYSGRTGGLHALVFGGRSDGGREAAQAYLATVTAADRRRAVIADADRVLTAARAVADAGLIGDAGPPSSTDVALLEEAIVELHRSRRLLTTALKLLREDGVPLTKAEIRELGDAFVQTARDIGTAADLAAARAEEPARLYADGPGTVSASY